MVYFSRRADSSVVERCAYIAEAIGSNPIPPTIARLLII